MRLPYLTPADIGRRVTVRAVRNDGSAFDTVGRLVATAAGHVEVEGRSGTVPLGWPPHPNPAFDRAIAGRVVKPDLCAIDMQLVAQSGWPPSESHFIGEWELRWAGGVSQRANSVRPGGDVGEPIDDALEAIRHWYTNRGGIPTLQVPRPWLADDLAGRGWKRERAVVLMTAPTRLTESVNRPDLEISLASTPDDRWLRAMDRDDAPDGRALEAILTASSRTAFVTAFAHDGSVAGIGRGVIAREWCGITSIVTTPQCRRRGVATAVTTSIMGWAQEHGVEQCFLQVLTTNESARALYDTAGFTVHHTYDYWTYREGSTT